MGLGGECLNRHVNLPHIIQKIAIERRFAPVSIILRLRMQRALRGKRWGCGTQANELCYTTLKLTKLVKKQF